MKTSVKQLQGNWDQGFALDKHVISSVFVGTDAYGHSQFNTIRSEAGEALFQLKYRNDWTKVEPLATAVIANIFARFSDVGFVIPMPASNARARQPVTEIAKVTAKLACVPIFESLLGKANGGIQLKNLSTKEEKTHALEGAFKVLDVIQGDGPWNAMLIDDLFDSGASMEAACTALRSYKKIRKIYVAAITWK